MENLRSAQEFERIRTIGKGAFGVAVLYRKKEEQILVVLKEIELKNLDANQRTKVLNEVQTLSSLNHPNIISFNDTYEDNGLLMIEMEYADGGNLDDRIKGRSENLFNCSPAYFSEEEVLCFFYQLLDGLKHIHDNNTIHRDIKTQNIFLTKDDIIKIGDFGISCVLESQDDKAYTAVGTPYYLSPEICKGLPYDASSDIWAMGCIIYELCTLKRPFESSNLYLLVQKIVAGEFEAISTNRFSLSLQITVSRMLSLVSEDRPTATELLALPLFDRIRPRVNKKMYSSRRRSSILQDTVLLGISKGSSSSLASLQRSIISSKDSQVFTWGGGKQTPQVLEVFQNNKSARISSAGSNHFLVATMEGELYSWGENKDGQLGHGTCASYRVPKLIEGTTGSNIIHIACGDNFSAAVSDTGELWLWGSNDEGCLGHGENGDSRSAVPRILPFFLNDPVVMIACGDHHVVALTVVSDVFAWGSGEDGRLGLGHEDFIYQPTKVKLPGQAVVSQVSCGRDGTFFLTSKGRLYACGNNMENCLGLDQPVGLLARRKNPTKNSVRVDYRTVPTPVKVLNTYKLVDVSLGSDHSASIDEYGQLIMMGHNKFGQLGQGDFKARIRPCIVKALKGKNICAVTCGDGFTIAATSTNEVFSWGQGDFGRLGNGYLVNSSLPRPIFGSLFHISCMSSRHWHSIIIAEKQISSRTVERLGSVDNNSIITSCNAAESNGNSNEFRASSKSPSELAESNLSNTFGSPLSSLSDDDDVIDDTLEYSTSFAPQWLQDELDEAEVINLASSSGEMPGKDSTQSLRNEIKALLTAKQSYERIIKEMEQKHMHEIVELNEQIDTLKETIKRSEK